MGTLGGLQETREDKTKINLKRDIEIVVGILAPQVESTKTPWNPTTSTQ